MKWNGARQQLELQCVNWEPLPVGMPYSSANAPPPHVMKLQDGWGVVGEVRPPDWEHNVPAMPSSKGIPMRVYVCQTCGYVEMYSGLVVAKEVWRPNG